MVKIPETPKRNLGQLIYQMYEAEAKDWRREHLGASQIGKECWRALYYDFHWVTPPGFSGRILRLFERGNREEDWIATEIRKLGDFHGHDIRIRTVDPDTGEQFLVSYFGGHFGGSCDGILSGLKEAPKTEHLWECKTSNAKYFKQLQTMGVKKAKPEHYTQMQTYMHGLKLTRAYYVCVNKDTDEFYIERVYYDKTFALKILDKAEAIVFAETPPTRVSEDPSFFKCRFCNHKNVCHGLEKIAPEVNCRTCAHVTAKPDGTWHCDVFNGRMDLEIQREGCPSHIYIPYLLEGIFGKFIFSASDGPSSLVVQYDNGVVNDQAPSSSKKIKERFSC